MRRHAPTPGSLACRSCSWLPQLEPSRRGSWCILRAVIAEVAKNRPRVVVVMPAFNAARTLGACVAEVPRDLADDIVLVDDASHDDTVAIARGLGLTVLVHPENLGYGGNQKTCYREALRRDAGIVVMVHPDHQYNPQVIPQLLEPLLAGRADAVFGSRMLGGAVREGGMPWWKVIGNVALTKLENAVFGLHLTEYHSGFRAYSRAYLESVNLAANSDDFVFDSEIIAQGVVAGMRIAEIPIATRYFPEASQIGFGRSVVYGLAIFRLLVRFALHRRWCADPQFTAPRVQGSGLGGLR